MQCAESRLVKVEDRLLTGCSNSLPRVAGASSDKSEVLSLYTETSIRLLALVYRVLQCRCTLMSGMQHVESSNGAKIVNSGCEDDGSSTFKDFCMQYDHVGRPRPT